MANPFAGLIFGIDQAIFKTDIRTGNRISEQAKVLTSPNH
jgi:hypothetical protein